MLGTGAGLAAAATLGSLTRPTRAMASASDQPPASPDLFVPSYADGRPVATLRMDAVDQGIVLRHGDGPGRCDAFGARDVWVFEDHDMYYMHYDGAGDDAWLACLATSPDGLNWTKSGVVLKLGAPGSPDSASASYGTTYKDGRDWHMFYIGTQFVSPPHNIPAVPYVTLKAKSTSPTGPWVKQPDIVPFAPQPGTYYEETASAGQIIKQGNGFLQYFSASAFEDGRFKRTIGIARTQNLEDSWQVDPTPVVPLEEQIENSALYYEVADDTWYLFTNHVGLYADAGGEYTDAIWAYWSDDPTNWDPDQKVVVLDRNNCAWSSRVVGLPSVLRIGNKLAIYYDGVTGTSTSHLDRDIGLAWLDLPLKRPVRRGPRNLALAATTSASSTFLGYDAANVVDGSTSTALGPTHSWTNDLISVPDGTSWVWYPEGPEGGADMPNGALRFFRKTLELPDQTELVKAQILTTADDQFTLYVNGTEAAGSPQVTNAWQSAVLTDVTSRLHTGTNTLAASATNGTGPAGFLAALQLRSADGTVRNVLTDGSWLSFNTEVNGWQRPDFDDTAWPVALVEAPYGSGPWGSAVFMPPDLPQWVQIRFERAETFSRIELYTTSGFELTDYRLQGWQGSSWVDIVPPVRGNTTVLRIHSFDPFTTDRIRVLGERTASQPGSVRVNEIQVY